MNWALNFFNCPYQFLSNFDPLISSGLSFCASGVGPGFPFNPFVRSFFF